MFEKGIVLILLVLMMITIVASVVELSMTLATQLMHPPIFSLNTEQAMKIFGFFLTVLIGLELLESTKVYLEKNRVHAEVVFLVAIIAVSRKVITLNYARTSSETLFGVSALILSLGIGYYLVRRALEQDKLSTSPRRFIRWRKPSPRHKSSP